MLFRIAFMVHEKKLGAILTLLSEQKIVNLETPTPVRIADDRAYTDIIDLAGKSEITTAEIKAQLIAAGKPETAMTYAIRQLVAAKMLKQNGKRGVYKVIKAPGAPKGRRAK